MQSLWETNLIAKAYARHFTAEQRALMERLWLGKAIAEHHLMDEALIAKLYESYKTNAQVSEETAGATVVDKTTELLKNAVDDGKINQSTRDLLSHLLNQPRTIHSTEDLDQLRSEMEMHCEHTFLIRDLIITQYSDEIQALQFSGESNQAKNELSDASETSSDSGNSFAPSKRNCSIIDAFVQSGFDQNILTAYLEVILDPRSIQEEWMIRYALDELRNVGKILMIDSEGLPPEQRIKLNLMGLEEKKEALTEILEADVMFDYYKRHKKLESLTSDEFFEQFTFLEFIQYYKPSTSCLFDEPLTLELYQGIMESRRRVTNFIKHSIQQLVQRHDEQQDTVSESVRENDQAINQNIDQLIRKYLSKYRSTELAIPKNGPERRALIECAFRNAANQDHLKDLQALLPYVFDINAKGAQTGKTALHYTASYTERTGKASTCREFLLFQANIDSSILDNEGKSADDITAEKGTYVAVEDTSIAAAEAVLLEHALIPKDQKYYSCLEQCFLRAVSSSKHITPLAMARLLVDIGPSLRRHICEIYAPVNKAYSSHMFGHTYHCEIVKNGFVVSSQACHASDNSMNLDDPMPMLQAQWHMEIVIDCIADSETPELTAKIISHLYRPGFVDNLELTRAMESKMLGDQLCYGVQSVLHCRKDELEAALPGLTRDALSTWLTPSSASQQAMKA